MHDQRQTLHIVRIGSNFACLVRLPSELPASTTTHSRYVGQALVADDPGNTPRAQACRWETSVEQAPETSGEQAPASHRSTDQPTSTYPVLTSALRRAVRPPGFRLGQSPSPHRSLQSGSLLGAPWLRPVVLSPKAWPHYRFPPASTPCGTAGKLSQGNGR